MLWQHPLAAPMIFRGRAQTLAQALRPILRPNRPQSLQASLRLPGLYSGTNFDFPD
jgi:hypothetical protein